MRIAGLAAATHRSKQRGWFGSQNPVFGTLWDGLVGTFRLLAAKADKLKEEGGWQLLCVCGKEKDMTETSRCVGPLI